MSFDIFPSVKTLTDRVSAQRAAWFDRLQYVTQSAMANLDAAMSSRASESTTAKSATCSETRLAKLDGEIRGVRIVRNYTTAINPGQVTVDVTITAVIDTTKTQVTDMSWHQTSSNTPDYVDPPSVRLLNSTTVRVQHATGTLGNRGKQVYFSVVEWY
jgi:NADPH-dependent curcumin reductase CurA